MGIVEGLNIRDVIWGTSTVSRTCLHSVDLCEFVNPKWAANRPDTVRKFGKSNEFNR
jgi:hypothetical protein